MKVPFISFEGIDNCGKSTQIRLLQSYLNSKNISNEVIREPGGTALGAALRRLLKEPNEVYSMMNKHFADEPDFIQIPTNQLRSSQAEALLFLASRSDFVEHLLKPNLEKGIIVIADRFVDSTRAYQGGGRLLGDKDMIKRINWMNDFAIQQVWPDITFILDISYEEMLARSTKNLDYMERQGKEFFEGVIQEYRRIAQEDSGRVVLVDGTMQAEEIFENYIKPTVKLQLSFN